VADNAVSALQVLDSNAEGVASAIRVLWSETI